MIGNNEIIQLVAGNWYLYISIQSFFELTLSIMPDWDDRRHFRLT